MNRNSARMLSRRTQIVWGSFFFIIPCALFILQASSTDVHNGVVLTKLAPVSERPAEDIVVTSIDDQLGWDTIVIHHLGQPAGSPESLDRAHRKSGLSGLGYHFLIGNGNGLDDGDVHVGYRWLNQISAAKPVDVDPSHWSDGTITVCLVGNGNRRPFTDQQLEHLSHLVQRLQLELSISPQRVLLAQEVGSDETSPGLYFAEAQFRSQLLDIPSLP
jgi:N-acetylmuramoyl-L-alanine amidase